MTPSLALAGVLAVAALALPHPFTLGPLLLDALTVAPLAALAWAFASIKATDPGADSIGRRALVGLGLGAALLCAHPGYGLAGLGLAALSHPPSAQGAGALRLRLSGGLSLAAAGAIWALFFGPGAVGTTAHLPVVVQLRLAAVVGGVAVVVGALALVPGAGRAPLDPSGRSGQTLLLVGAAAVLARGLAPAAPEVVRLLAAPVLWSAAGLAALGLLGGAPARVAAAAALAGLTSATPLGAAAVSLGLTGGLMAATGLFNGPARGALGWAVVLPAAAAAAFSAATVHGAGLAVPAAAFGGATLLAASAHLLRRSATEAPAWSQRWLPGLAVTWALVGAAPHVLGVLPGGQRAALAQAERASVPSLPVDDVGGHRRLWQQRERQRPMPAQDAGVP